MALIGTGISYSVDEPDYDDSIELEVYDWKRTDFDLEDDWDIEIVAEACADHYAEYCDGWERTRWRNGNDPLIIYIWKNPEESIKMEVYCEFEPSYTAYKVEDESN